MPVKALRNVKDFDLSALSPSEWKSSKYTGDDYVDNFLIRFDERAGVVHFLEGVSVALLVDFETDEVIGLHIEGIHSAIMREIKENENE